MTKSLNKDMGDAHEEFLAELLVMRKARGSGNQWRDPIDARHNRLDTEWAFAIDGKSTLAKSISITRAMWDKAVEQAGGERPLLGLRFYDTASLRDIHADLIASDARDFAEMREAALKWEKARPLVEALVERKPRCIPVLVECLQRLLKEADAL